MTVIHILEPFDPGPAEAAATIARQLPDMRHIVVHGIVASGAAPSIENVKKEFPLGTDFIKMSFTPTLPALFSLAGILKQRKGNETIVHLHSFKAGFIGAFVCLLSGIKKNVYTPHSAPFIRTDAGMFMRGFYRLLEKLRLKTGGAVVACGQSEADLYKKYQTKKKPALCAPNGVQCSPRSRVEMKFTRFLNPDEESYVVFAGVINKQKNPAMFNEIASAMPGVRFVWVGDGPLRSVLRAPNITVTGWVNKSQVYDYLDRALIYLSAAAWEGLPFGALEAMSAGCALLVSNVYGNRDLVFDNKNGFVFSETGEAVMILKEMFENRDKVIAMGRKSREFAEYDFSAEQMGTHYRSIYETLSTTGVPVL